MNDLTHEQLALDKKLAEEATPGPWFNDSNDPSDVVVWGPRDTCHGDQQFIGNVGGTNFKDVSIIFDADLNNGNFIARFNPKTALAYIAALEESRAELAAKEAFIAKLKALLEEANQELMRASSEKTWKAFWAKKDELLAQLGEKG